MKFKDSLISKVIMIPTECWTDNDIYHFLLKLPYIVLIVVVGIPISILCDFIHSIYDGIPS